MVFMGYIKQGSDTTLKAGPLLTSAGAPATGLGLVAADCKISITGGALTAKTGTNPSEDSLGVYDVPVTGAANVASTGRFSMVINKTGALPWRGDWVVLDPESFDTWISGTAPWAVELTPTGITALDQQIQDSVTAVSEQPSATGTITTVGAINTPTAGQQVITLGGSAVSGTNRYKEQTLWIGDGTGAGQSRGIRSQTGLAVTVDNFDIQPAAGDLYVVDWGSQSVLPTTIGNVSNLDATVSSRASASALATVQADTDDVQARLPAALVGGRMDASVGAMAANVMTAAAAAADLTTELQANLALASALATAQTAISDIQARLPATLLGGRVRAHVELMGADTVDTNALATSAVAEIQSGRATLVALTDGTVVAGTVSDKTGYRLSATGVDDIWDEPIPEPTGVFSWASATARKLVGWRGVLDKNKKIQTPTSVAVRNDADTADLATGTVSDTAGVATKGTLT